MNRLMKLTWQIVISRFDSFEIVPEIHGVYLETVHESRFREDMETKLKSLKFWPVESHEAL
jgi:hypothetical protein